MWSPMRPREGQPETATAAKYSFSQPVMPAVIVALDRALALLHSASSARARGRLPHRALSVAHAHIESALAVVSSALSLMLVSKRPPPRSNA